MKAALLSRDEETDSFSRVFVLIPRHDDSTSRVSCVADGDLIERKRRFVFFFHFISSTVARHRRLYYHLSVCLPVD